MQAIDAHIPVCMRINSVFLNMRKIITKMHYNNYYIIITIMQMYIIYLVAFFLRWLATRPFLVLLLVLLLVPQSVHIL